MRDKPQLFHTQASRPSRGLPCSQNSSALTLNRFSAGLCHCGCGLLAPIAQRTQRGKVKGQPCDYVNGHNSRCDRSSIEHKNRFEFKAFWDAKNRCNNSNIKNWKDYGGRGIKFLFTSFEQFITHIGPRPDSTSLDRINNDGNYEPGNVRWATSLEQIHNRNRQLYLVLQKVTIKRVRSWSAAGLCLACKGGAE